MGENQNSTGDDGGLKGYLTRHMLIGIVLVVVVIIALKIILGFLEPSSQMLTDASGVAGHDRVGVEAVLPQDSHRTSDELTLTVGHEVKALEGSDVLLSRNTEPAIQEIPAHDSGASQTHGADEKMNVQPAAVTSRPAVAHQDTVAEHPAEQKTVPTHSPAPDSVAGHATETHGAGKPETPSFPVEGMAFVDAVIQPLEHELNQRFYGWRPNDILNVTDNVNNF